MMEGSVFSSPDAAITMRTFSMHRVAETFSNKAPLNGGIFISIERYALICASAHGTKIYDETLPEPRAQGITFLPGRIAHAKAQKADDYVVCINIHRIVAQGNTITGGCLACDSYIIVLKTEVGF